MKQIQWYPGHMAKTKRIVADKIKLIDVVIELLDARIPLSSRNPVIKELIGKKHHLVIFNKSDLADENELSKWKKHFEELGIYTLNVDSISGKGVNRIYPKLREIMAPTFKKEISQGRKERPIRTMILGIPNVGKSTLINKIAKKGKLNAEDRPGVTRQTQYIRVNQDMELLDTPGILWPKFEDDDVAFKLALIGAIKDDILPKDDVCIYGFKLLDRYYKKQFEERYNIIVNIDDVVSIFDDIGRKRGCIIRGNQIDYERVSDLFLHDFRHGRFGKIMLDRINV